MNGPSLAALLPLAAEHRVLGEKLERHLEALVGMEFAVALADLEEFARDLHRHIRREELELLPVYAALDGIPRQGRPEFFIQEHRKIEDLLAGMLASMRALTAGPRARQGVLDLLERGFRLRSLLEHHERREEATLFPCLRRFVEESGRRRPRAPRAGPGRRPRRRR